MSNILYKNIVVDAFSELVPSILIAPLNLGLMPQPERVPNIHELFDTDRHVSLHRKARYAITAALEDLHLQKEDVVTILTTSGNFYVSGCVTKAIEQVCRWNREICAETKAILVIHEFGYPYKGLSELRKYGLPIIEDCAYAFLSKDDEIGQVGDYVIYSLPKAFNMQLGGVMLSHNKVANGTKDAEANYILSHAYCGMKEKNSIIEKRLQNYDYLCNSLTPLEITPFFDLNEGVVPGTFLFKWRDDIDYPTLKEFMQRNGVESSVFYGKNAFFIPMHHNLSKGELDYMIKLIEYFNAIKV